MLQPANALLGIDVTVFGMTTTAWQGNGVTVGFIDGLKEGVFDGNTVGLQDGDFVGFTVGRTDGIKEGAILMEGAEVGARERGSELQVGRPEPAHAGYTQAAVAYTGPKGVTSPKVIPAHFSMITIFSLLPILNAFEPTNVTLLGMLTDVRPLLPLNAY